MALGDDLEILGRCELFDRFEPEALRLLAFAAEHRTLRQGQVLFSKGDRADSAYVVKSGKLALSGGDPDERRPVMAGPGALIGKLALFIRNTRPVSAAAIEATEVLRIPPTLMRRILEEFPACAEIAHEAVRQDLEEMSSQLLEMQALFEKSGEA